MIYKISPRLTFLIIFVYSLMVSGCNQINLTASTGTAQNTDIPKLPSAQSFVKTQTATSTLEAVSIPPMTHTPPEPTLQPTVETPPENIMKVQCLEVAPKLPLAANLSGRITLWQSGIRQEVFLDLANGTRTQILGLDETGSAFQFSTSPDGKWLAYVMYKTGQKDLIVVESADGKQKKRIQWSGKEGSLFIREWLDNNQIYFMVTRYKYYATLVINPFTGKQTEFLPENLNNIIEFYNDSSIFFAGIDILPDPSLKLMVYPQMGEKSYEIVLADLNTKKVLSKVDDFNRLKHDPLWSVDGADFLIASAVSMNQDTHDPAYEWFQVTRNGKVSQLTHFADYFASPYIGDASRSPDGRKVAFRFDDGPDKEKGVWAILDINSQTVINTCIPSTGLRPVWSPDSRYLVVGDLDDNADGRVILVDTVQNWAAQIAENFIPQGWLNKP